jgi:hypothetical protein
MRHSNVEPNSVELKEKLAEVALTVPEGPDEIEVSGGEVSVAWTVQVYEAGAISTLPAGSVARTPKVWLPADKLE